MRIGDKRRLRNRQRRRGAMLAMLAVLMVAFMVVAALTIDIAHLRLARTELRTATDAAAKAAAVNLARTSDPVLARQWGAEIASQNEVLGRSVSLAADDFEFGHAVEDGQTGRIVFFPGRSPENAVRVTSVQVDAGLEGAFSLWLGSIMKRNGFEVSASATAACLDDDVVVTVSQAMSE